MRYIKFVFFSILNHKLGVYVEHCRQEVPMQLHVAILLPGSA